MKTELEKLHGYHPVIHVSQEAIDKSIPKNKHWCAWSNSICESIVGVNRLNCDVTLTRFSLRGFRFTYKTPDKAAMMAHLLDTRGKGSIKPQKIALGNPLGVVPIIPARRAKATNVKSGKFVGKNGRACTKSRSIRWNGLALSPRLMAMIQKRNKHAAYVAKRRRAAKRRAEKRT